MDDQILDDIQDDVINDSDADGEDLMEKMSEDYKANDELDHYEEAGLDD